ncbi:MAG: response regulator [Pseudomonadota bacterium]
MLLAEALAAMGHDVDAVVTTAAAAVAAAVRRRPDLMIVDERLGDGSGLSAVEEILRGGPVPHIFATGDVSRIRALRPGAAIIEKPFGETVLAQAIERALAATAAS